MNNNQFALNVLHSSVQCCRLDHKGSKATLPHDARLHRSFLWFFGEIVGP